MCMTKITYCVYADKERRFTNMGFLDKLLDIASNISDAAERNSDEYSSGYEYGSKRASNMSDAELRSNLKRAKEGGVSDWNSAGKTRAMVDEYKRRNDWKGE